MTKGADMIQQLNVTIIILNNKSSKGIGTVF